MLLLLVMVSKEGCFGFLIVFSQVLSSVVVEDPAKQEWLVSVGALPLLERLCLYPDATTDPSVLIETYDFDANDKRHTSSRVNKYSTDSSSSKGSSRGWGWKGRQRVEGGGDSKGLEEGSEGVQGSAGKKESGWFSWWSWGKSKAEAYDPGEGVGDFKSSSSNLDVAEGGRSDAVSEAAGQGHASGFNSSNSTGSSSSLEGARRLSAAAIAGCCDEQEQLDESLQLTLGHQQHQQESSSLGKSNSTRPSSSNSSMGTSGRSKTKVSSFIYNIALAQGTASVDEPLVSDIEEEWSAAAAAAAEAEEAAAASAAAAGSGGVEVEGPGLCVARQVARLLSVLVMQREGAVRVVEGKWLGWLKEKAVEGDCRWVGGIWEGGVGG